MCFGDCSGIFRKGEGKGPNEMEFQQANATDAACIQRLPAILGQEWLLFDRQLPLQRPQHTPKFLALFLLGHIVARKVDINTPTC